MAIIGPSNVVRSQHSWMLLLVLIGGIMSVVETARMSSCELQYDCFDVTFEVADSSYCGAASRKLSSGGASDCDWLVCMVWDFDKPSCVKENNENITNTCTRPTDYCSNAFDFSTGSLTFQPVNGHSECVIAQASAFATFLVRDMQCDTDTITVFDVDSTDAFCSQRSDISTITDCEPEGTNGENRECYWQIPTPECPTSSPTISASPSTRPSTEPTASPTLEPTTSVPSAAPSSSPSSGPTATPTLGPTPTPDPTVTGATLDPTATPVTPDPTATPVTPDPTASPTLTPAGTPSPTFITDTPGPTMSPTTTAPTTAEPTEASCDCCSKDRDHDRLLLRRSLEEALSLEGGSHNNDDDDDDDDDRSFDCEGYCQEGGGYNNCNNSAGGGSDDGGCFSEKATVQVLHKGVISISDLQVGDKVLTAGQGSGSYSYEDVYGFGHYHMHKKMEFIKISYTGSYDDHARSLSPLEITGNHLVFVNEKEHPVRADSIQVGDLLRTEYETAVLVTKIQKVTRKGVYAPLTHSGTIVVDGIVASTYISLQPNSVEYAEFTNGHKMTWLTQQQGCHMWMSPLRLLCMGVSTSFCEEYDEDGQLFWVHFGQKFLLWGMEYNLLVQAILLGATGVMTTIFYSMELVFGARYALFIVGILTAVFWLSRILLKKGEGAVTVVVTRGRH